jgi:tetratricopeptide (TPR) repeat protein
MFKKAQAVLASVSLAGVLSVAPTFTGLVSEDLASALGTQAQAQEKKKITRSLPGISNKIFEGLGKAGVLANPSEEDKAKGKVRDLAGAKKELVKIEKRCIKEECNGYEMSQIYAMFAFVAFQEENTPEAVKYYKQVVAQTPMIPIGVELQNLWYIAQLQYSQEKYDDAILHVQKWKKLANETGNEITPDIYYFEAVVCYNADDNACALKNINQAVSMIEAKPAPNNVAEESWYNLQRVLYINREDFKTAATILEKMIRHYPKKSYYAQLPSLYGALGRDNDQMYALDAAFAAGALSRESELINLAKIYLSEESPFEAAKIIEKGMNDKVIARNEKNLSLLGIAWRAAKDPAKAVPVLKAAAKDADTGEHDANLVAVYLDLEQPKNAIAAGKEALRKGKLKGQLAGEVHVNMGTAYTELRQYSNAIEAFDKGAKYERYRKFALGWKRYTENELKRYNGLKESLAALGVDIDKVIN